MKKYIFFTAAAIALTACNSEESYIGQPVSEPLRLSATIGDNTLARASNTTWAIDDAIGVSMSGRYSNVKYVTENGDGKFDGSVMYFKNKQEPVTISAYYPFSGTEGQAPEVISASTTVDLQTDAEQPKFDFLYAVKDNVTGAQPDVNLAFSHKMSKVTLVFINGNDGTDVSKITSVQLKGLYLSGTFNPVTGACEANTEIPATDINLTPTVVKNEPLHPLILFPQNVSKVTLNLRDSEDQNYSCELNFGSNGLESSNNYLFKITVKKTQLSVTTSIVEWNDVIIKEEAKSDDTDDTDDSDDTDD